MKAMSQQLGMEARQISLHILTAFEVTVKRSKQVCNLSLLEILKLCC